MPYHTINERIQTKTIDLSTKKYDFMKMFVGKLTTMSPTMVDTMSPACELKTRHSVARLWILK